MPPAEQSERVRNMMVDVIRAFAADADDSARRVAMRVAWCEMSATVMAGATLHVDCPPSTVSACSGLRMAADRLRDMDRDYAAQVAVIVDALRQVQSEAELEMRNGGEG